jgi:tetratricopeptide (TPR) repeat protein
LADNEEDINKDDSQKAEDEINIDDTKEQTTQEEIIQDAPKKSKKQAIIRNVEHTPKKKSLNVKKIFIVVIPMIFISIIIIMLIMYILDIDINMDVKPKNKEKKVSIPEPVINRDKFNSLTKKADKLYIRGDKISAFKAYEKLTQYTYSISYYNIGVSYMKTRDFKKAVLSFKKSIKYEDNLCISSINAAVSSLELGNQRLFEYYINLAYSSLPKSINDPLYDISFALIMYYKKNYFESAVILKNMDIPTYKNIKHNMLSNIFLLLDSNIDSVKHIEKTKKQTPRLLYRGLMYAKIGEYDLALKKLKKAEKLGENLERIVLAIALIYLKQGAYVNASVYLKKAYNLYNGKNLDFPIKVKFKDSFVSVDHAQKHIFDIIKIPNSKRVYDLLFYFAPYKMFNAGESISYIKRGNKNLYIDNVNRARRNYKQSIDTSVVTGELVKAIKFAINQDIVEANSIFLQLTKRIHEDSTVYYDLGLSYAQLENYKDAYINFRKSFYLDKSNILSGVFTIMTARLLNQTSNILTQDVIQSIDKYIGDENDINFYKALLGMADDNINSKALNFLESQKYDTTLKNITALLIAMKSKRYNHAKQVSVKLKQKIPDNVVANILSFYAKNVTLDIKKFAQNSAIFLKNKSLKLDYIYHGPSIARKLYVELTKISGLGFTLRDILKEKVITQAEHTSGVLQALALADLHLGLYEESYVLYNKLIDDFKQADSQTLFFGSVAAMGAKHFANASILLKLASIKDPTNYEAKLALGLLFLQNGNIKSAEAQISAIKSNNFQSEYFDFEIDNKKYRINNAKKDSNITK